MEDKDKKAVQVRTFDQNLTAFNRATKDSMKYALACSLQGLAHYAEHGDLVYCQRFFDAMPQNWTRKQAYLKWLVAHAPITMVNKKFVKDTAETASPLDLDGAAKKPFWEFAPEMAIIDFSAEDLDGALVQLIKRYEGKRYVATDAAAIARFNMIKGMVEALTGTHIEAANGDAPSADGPVSEEHPAEAVAA